MIGWVAPDGLSFAPGSRYKYSNTDNIVVGLIAQEVTGESYGDSAAEDRVRPREAAADDVSDHGRHADAVHPRIRRRPRAAAQDLSTFLSPSGAWASGAIVSTPADLSAFIRDDLGARVLRRPQQRQQLRFVAGLLEPARAGGKFGRARDLPLPDAVRHRLRSHRELPRLHPVGGRDSDGKRSVTTSLNIPAPTGRC